MNTAEIIAAINNMDPTGDNWQKELFDICQQARTLGVTEEIAAALFQLVERCPDTYFGNPGPIVHALESFADFETGLEASVKRRPVPSTIVMINRALNLQMTESKRKKWLNLLEESTYHPAANQTVRTEAQGILQYQMQH
jgi:hypothetical protein